MEKKCCICGETFNGYGNNAEPVEKGTCCDCCNMFYVVPARLIQQEEPEANFANGKKNFANIQLKLNDRNMYPLKVYQRFSVYANDEGEKVYVVF